MDINCNIFQWALIKFLCFPCYYNLNQFLALHIECIIIVAYKVLPLTSTKGLVINYGEGGYKMGKSRVQNFLRPPQDRVKLVTAPRPLFFLIVETFCTPPPFNMAKTSSYCIKITPKHFVPPPPPAWLKLFPSPTIS